MSLILRGITAVVVLLVGTGAFVYYFPEQTARIAIGAINKITPQNIDIDMSVTPQIPDKIKDIWDKNPTEEQDYLQDLPINPELITEGKVSLLGRPKKIVEYFCQNDNQCVTYFKNPYAECETSSGICYLD